VARNCHPFYFTFNPKNAVASPAGRPVGQDKTIVMIRNICDYEKTLMYQLVRRIFLGYLGVTEICLKFLAKFQGKFQRRPLRYARGKRCIYSKCLPTGRQASFGLNISETLTKLFKHNNILSSMLLPLESKFPPKADQPQAEIPLKNDEPSQFAVLSPLKPSRQLEKCKFSRAQISFTSVINFLRKPSFKYKYPPVLWPCTKYNFCQIFSYSLNWPHILLKLSGFTL
jgi:hypothetical protein